MEREALCEFRDQDSILTPDDLRAMFMQRPYTVQDVEKLLVSHAALVRKISQFEARHNISPASRSRGVGGGDEK